jgi:short-subunit dehydrogenase
MARVLITGCSTGFGRASAVELTKRGHDVVATARKPETLDELDVVDRIGLDIDDDASVNEAVAKAGTLDALVNNAGFGVVGPIEKVPLAEARRLFDTNVFGTMRMVQAVAPGMRERGSGTIVNVASLAGRVAPPLGGVYAASKWAVEGMSEALHYELGHFGVRVRLVEPGFFATEFQGKEPSLRSGRRALRRARPPVAGLVREAAGRRGPSGPRAGGRGHRRRGRERRTAAALAGGRGCRHGPHRADVDGRRGVRGRDAERARPHLVAADRSA